MFSLPGENWLRLIVWLLLGIVIYFGYGKRHSVLARTRDRGKSGRPIRVMAIG
jgi:basic amino acid/polyamine antiporter, APA family